MWPISKKDLSDLDFVISGYKNKITINTCNPESLKRYIVGYCNELLSFNEEIIYSKYEKIKYIKK
ncbi:hypothetical protein [Spiroplasma endosymbiont of Polydrusus formosus]|uniref:hypothetical protein n=1 Tax=Spiroplasma endosymbiont of Polydrusus formosus TaxID=3139326 RepID=UPI0035B52827